MKARTWKPIRKTPARRASWPRKLGPVALLAGAIGLLVLGCKGFEQFGAPIAGGVLRRYGINVSDNQLRGFSQAVRKSNMDITEAEEYYLGRAVAAEGFRRYPASRSGALNDYVNKVGLTVALASDRASIYDGWHFAVVESQQLNAFAAPGGFIFVTTGMLRAIRTEDELAGVLAHEVAHVAQRHPIETIKSSYARDLFSIPLRVAAQNYTDQEIGQLARTMTNMVTDLAATLWEKGYSRDQEREADRKAVEYCAQAGYDPNALVRLLQRLPSTGGGMLSTHPSWNERASNVSAAIRRLSGPVPTELAARQQRYRQFVR